MDKLKLQADCNSLNGIASMLNHLGYYGQAGSLLTVQKHLEEICDTDPSKDFNNGMIAGLAIAYALSVNSTHPCNVNLSSPAPIQWFDYIVKGGLKDED